MELISVKPITHPKLLQYLAERGLKKSDVLQEKSEGSVLDYFDERIEKKGNSADIVVDSANVSADMKAYHLILIIAEFTNEDDADNLKETIEANYKCVKQDVLTLVTSEIDKRADYE